MVRLHSLRVPAAQGWRVSGKRIAESDERIRCTRVLGGRANKSDGYLLGSYRIATAPEPNFSRRMSLKSTCFDSHANNVGP
jgi:hypothetical protein